MAQSEVPRSGFSQLLFMLINVSEQVKIVSVRLLLHLLIYLLLMIISLGYRCCCCLKLPLCTTTAPVDRRAAEIVRLKVN